MVKNFREGLITPKITSNRSCLGPIGRLGVITPGGVWGRVAERIGFSGFWYIGTWSRDGFWGVPVESVVALEAAGKGTAAKGALSRATQRKQWERFVMLAVCVRVSP